MKALLYFLLDLSARVLNKLSRMVSGVAKRLEPDDMQRQGVVGSTGYDMVAAPDEPFYAEQYWRAILPHLETLPKSAKALDLGCSQGRFTTRLATLFSDGRVVGCDLSADAIDEAKNYAAAGSVGNIDFRVQSIVDCVKEFNQESMDVVVMTEVTIFYPEWEEDFPEIIRTLKPGGILIVSFRSQYFDALCVTRNRLWESVEPVLRDRKGAIFDSSIVFTWQTSAEIKRLFVEKHGLELLELCGIGVCSGIPGDPHDHISRPSQLNYSERERLMELETELGKSVPDGGRYILAVARTPRGTSL